MPADRKEESELLESIEIRFHTMGADIVFLVTGGAAHIGAIATAYMSDDATQVIDTKVLVLPCHREGELAAELAEMAFHALHRTVAVLVGIHLNQPSKQDIERIMNNAKNTMKQILEQAQRSGSSLI